MSEHQPPVWDRGDPIDAEMLRFTIGEDWRMDQRLVTHDLRGSLAHVEGLVRAGLVSEADGRVLSSGLEELQAAHARGEWTVESGDEDVHSAVERRLFDRIGETAGRLHTARSRNEQVALDLRLWLRESSLLAQAAAERLERSLRALAERRGALPLPGYTHLRRAMPSTLGDWASAHAQALALDQVEFEPLRRRIARCPLGSGSGYGLPLALARAAVAERLGFEGPEEPVTLVQHGRGRAELAYATALEAVCLDAGKLAFDLWLFSATEFGFAHLPESLTTGSSLMPNKRNPDVLELARAEARQVSADRDALLAVLRDLPSGYHRDFQLLKPPLFRAHDRALALLSILARVVDGLEWDEAALSAAVADPALDATRRALEQVQRGVPFREAYRTEARSAFKRGTTP